MPEDYPGGSGGYVIDAAGVLYLYHEGKLVGEFDPLQWVLDQDGDICIAYGREVEE